MFCVNNLQDFGKVFVFHLFFCLFDAHLTSIDKLCVHSHEGKLFVCVCAVSANVDRENPIRKEKKRADGRRSQTKSTKRSQKRELV